MLENDEGDENETRFLLRSSFLPRRYRENHSVTTEFGSLVQSKRTEHGPEGKGRRGPNRPDGESPGKTPTAFLIK